MVRFVGLLRPFSLAREDDVPDKREIVLETLASLRSAYESARFSNNRSRLPYYRLVPKTKLANIRFRQAIIKAGYEKPDFAAALVEMCRLDILFWVNAFCWTIDPRTRRGQNSPFGEVHCIPMITWTIQDAYILELQDSIGRCDILNEKSRDMGASWCGLYTFHWFWRFVPDCQFGLSSRSEEYVDEAGKHKTLFGKLDIIDRMMPEWLLPAGRARDKDYSGRGHNILRNVENNSAHSGEACTPNLFAGDRLTAMFLDEFPRFPTKTAFSVLASTRDTTRCRVFNGTSNGPGTAYYQVVKRTNCRRLRMHWTSSPLKRRGLYRYGQDGVLKIIDTAYWTDRCNRRNVSLADGLEAAARQVYDFDNQKFARDDDFPYRSPWFDNELGRCANRSEALQELEIRYDADQARFFNESDLAWHRDTWVTRNPVRMTGELDYTEEGRPDEFLERHHGHWKLWIPLQLNKRPPSKTRYIIGADIALGTTRGGIDTVGYSNSVLSVVDRHERRLVAQYVNSVIKPEEFATLAVAACHWFDGLDGPARLIWESNGPPGSMFTAAVRSLRFSNVYMRRTMTRVSRKVTTEMGWQSNATTRPIMFSLLRKALSKEGDFICPSSETLDECMEYVYANDSIEHKTALNAMEASEARENHGDRVISLGVCIVEMDADRNERFDGAIIPNNCMEARERDYALAELHQRTRRPERWCGLDERRVRVGVPA